MRRRMLEEAVKEIECPTCEGTGYPMVKQPDQPSRKIYPGPLYAMCWQGAD